MAESSFNAIDEFFRQEFVGVETVHRHSSTCGHIKVIHGDHVDFLVDGLLHHPHGTHCDNHGSLSIIKEYYYSFIVGMAV